jgi:hypothetical protein
MDYKFIILAIVGIIIAYLIYSYAFSLPGTTLTNSTNYLMNSSTNITFNTLGSTIYTSPTLSFYAWVYVNTPSTSLPTPPTGSTTIDKRIFTLNGLKGNKNSLSSDPNSMFYSWALDNTGQNLYVIYNNGTVTTPNVESSSLTSSASNSTAILALSNLPIQSWAFIAIVLDNSTASSPIMDVYLNGKLASSIILPADTTAIYKPPIPPVGVKSTSITSTATAGFIKASPNASAITFGSGQDVFIANLTAFGTPLTPNVVQKAYLSFAGKQNSVADATKHYGISFTRGSGHSMISNDFRLF